MRLPTRWKTAFTGFGVAALGLVSAGCVFTSMAKDYAFPDKTIYHYPLAPVEIGRSARGRLLLCLRARDANVDGCYALPALPKADPADSPARLQVKLAGLERVPPTKVEPFARLAVGARDLLLPDSGAVITLPEGFRLALPLYRGPPLAGVDDGPVVAALFDPKTKDIQLEFTSGRKVRLEEYSWLQLEPSVRSEFPFGRHTFYRPMPPGQPLLGSEARKLPLRPMDLRSILVTYTLTDAGPLERQVYSLEAGQPTSALYLGHYRTEPLRFRPWGLCLFVPAGLLDLLTGIAQVLFWYDELSRSCLLLR